MHELQIASNLMKAVLETVNGYENVEKVETVDLSIGKLTFVGEEQLRFCWGAITEDNVLLKGSELVFRTEDVEIRCCDCGYTGEMEINEDPMYHYIMPVFACPECKGDVEITKGKGILITNLKMVVDDGKEGAE